MVSVNIGLVRNAKLEFRHLQFFLVWIICLIPPVYKIDFWKMHVCIMNIYYIPINVPCCDTVNFLNLIRFSRSPHYRFLIPYQYSLKLMSDDAPDQYSLKLMTSQCISTMLFVKNVDYVTSGMHKK
jgi:hypothetical protein